MPMPTEPHWTAWVSALLTPAVAIFGGYIAFQQWRTARNKLKFDLFDRRMKVYEAAHRLVGVVFREGNVNDEALYVYAADVAQTEWLFDRKLDEFLNKHLFHQALKLQQLSAELEGMPVGHERTKKVNERAEIKKALTALPEKVLNAKFAPYLRLYH